MDDAVFTVTRDLDSRHVTYKLVVSDWAMANVDLDEADRRMIRECDGPDSTISDRLLALQMLMFRMEQQQKEVSEGQKT